MIIGLTISLAIWVISLGVSCWWNLLLRRLVYPFSLPRPNLLVYVRVDYWSISITPLPLWRPFLHTKLSSFSPDKVVMKDCLWYWFHEFVYEERFDPYEVPSSKVRKKRIYTNSTLSAISREERKEIFGEDEVLQLFLNMCDYIL